MNSHIEIWKIFEDDHLVTYAFGDMGLYKTRAKGKVVFFKKTSDIYLVETIDKSITRERYDTSYLPRLKQSLNIFRSKGTYPEKMDIPESPVKDTGTAKALGASMASNWQQAVIPDEIKSRLNKVLVSFFTVKVDDFMELIGTGFIVAVAGRNAVVMTAASVFQTVGVARRLKRLKRPAGSVEFQVQAGRIFPMDEGKIMAAYTPDKDAVVCSIKGVSLSPELGIALCMIEFQERYKGADFSHKLSLDSRPPKKGDQVAAIGFTSMKPDNADGSGEGNAVSHRVAKAMEMRVGRITGVFHNGSGKIGFPFFETDIPTDPGMRGGPVFPFNLPGSNMNACAVVLKDLSSPESLKNYSAPGRSFMGMIWPSFLLPVRTMLKAHDAPVESSLIELNKKGIVKDTGEAHKNIRIIKKDHQILSVARIARNAAYLKKDR